jgi:hypothetical protein
MPQLPRRFFEEVVKAASAEHVHLDPLDDRTL